MTDANRSEFLYVTFIKTTMEKLWAALLEPEFTKEYWFNCYQVSDWKKGSSWQLVGATSGKVMDAGEILDIDPPKRLVIKWRNEFKPELKEEGYSRCEILLEPYDFGTVKLTINHSIDRPNAKIIESVSGGWPRILSNLKSLLESGQVILPEKK